MATSLAAAPASTGVSSAVLQPPSIATDPLRRQSPTWKRKPSTPGARQGLHANHEPRGEALAPSPPEVPGRHSPPPPARPPSPSRPRTPSRSPIRTRSPAPGLAAGPGPGAWAAWPWRGGAGAAGPEGGGRCSGWGWLRWDGDGVMVGGVCV